jgi:hypothetical protein
MGIFFVRVSEHTQPVEARCFYKLHHFLKFNFTFARMPAINVVRMAMPGTLLRMVFNNASVFSRVVRVSLIEASCCCHAATEYLSSCRCWAG